MAKNNGNDIKALPDFLPDVKFNLKAQEQFANDKGIVFEHWAAMPSPIGKKSRGDYRRPDSLDTVSENGWIYKKVGEFVGTIIGNSHSNQIGQAAEGGIYDNSTARIVMPRKYKTPCTKNEEISLLPGDRIYAKNTTLKVGNYQQVDHNPNGVDILQFPILCVESLTDARGTEYTQGSDFTINSDGNIKWIQGAKSPGIDKDTGKGAVYSIRYTYNAFWYVQQLINEIRMTNNSDSADPARMPYHAVIQREYVYHNKNRGDAKDTNLETHTERTQVEDKKEQDIHPDDVQVKVDIRNFSSE